MNHNKNTAMLFFLLIVLIGVFQIETPINVEAKDKKTSLSRVRKEAYQIPSPVEFSEDQQRGLKIMTWVNGVGPFTFVIDTGAGITIISSKVAAQASVLSSNRTIELQGARNTQSITSNQVKLRQIAIGGVDNILPNQGRVVVVDSLPRNIDGILDPTEIFRPLGYIIDFPNKYISAFDPKTDPLYKHQLSSDGVIISWEADLEGNRPFIKINNRINALIDSGSHLGLAVSSSVARTLNIDTSAYQNTNTVYDINGQEILVHRNKPTTIWLDSMVLNKIPTDILERASTSTPILLGRDALRPFKVSFDPQNRLIEFLPASSN